MKRLILGLIILTTTASNSYAFTPIIEANDYGNTEVWCFQCDNTEICYTLNPEESILTYKQEVGICAIVEHPKAVVLNILN